MSAITILHQLHAKELTTRKAKNGGQEAQRTPLQKRKHSPRIRRRPHSFHKFAKGLPPGRPPFSFARHPSLGVARAWSLPSALRISHLVSGAGAHRRNGESPKARSSLTIRLRLESRDFKDTLKHGARPQSEADTCILSCPLLPVPQTGSRSSLGPSQMARCRSVSGV